MGQREGRWPCREVLKAVSRFSVFIKLDDDSLRLRPTIQATAPWVCPPRQRCSAAPAARLERWLVRSAEDASAPATAPRTSILERIHDAVRTTRTGSFSVGVDSSLTIALSNVASSCLRDPDALFPSAVSGSGTAARNLRGRARPRPTQSTCIAGSCAGRSSSVRSVR